MNAKQTRQRARLFVAEFMKLLPAEYNRELTLEVLQLNRRINVLEKQLMDRDGVLVEYLEE
jgi:hypothetical protein